MLFLSIVRMLFVSFASYHHLGRNHMHMQDSLLPLAQYMQHAVGSDHAVTTMVHRLAEANLSSATKARRQEQQKLLEVKLFMSAALYMKKNTTFACILEGCSEQAALERQDLSCTYLAHHEN